MPDLVFWLGAGNQLNKSKDYVRAQKCPNSTEIIFADLKLLQKNHNGLWNPSHLKENGNSEQI